jgi:hypothetical protein
MKTIYSFGQHQFATEQRRQTHRLEHPHAP